MSDLRADVDRSMDLVDLVKVLLRQWLIVVIGAVVTVATGLAVISVVPPTFQASGQLILLLKPQATGEDTPTNPYLNLDSNLTTVASLLATSQSTPGAQEDREEAGFEAESSVTLQPGVGPVVSISTAHTDPAMALSTRDEIIGRMQADLATLQDDADAPDRQRIESRTLSAPQETVRLSGSKFRALAVVGALGAVLTLALAVLRDRGGRSRQVSAGRADAGEDDPVEMDVPRVRPTGGRGRRVAS